jgi:hypothetical protein
MEAMKRVLIALKIIALVSIHFIAIRAEIGCIDNSYHMDPCMPWCDDKQYHYVNCSCPCSQYAQSFDRGRCERCEHFHVPKPFIIIQRANLCR